MERIGTLVVAPTTDRKAEPDRFATALRNATSDIVSGVAGSLALASPYVPGGAVLAGALRSTVPSVAVSATGVAPPALAGASAGSTGFVSPLATATASALPAGSAAVPAGTAVGTGSGDLMEATRLLQQQAQTFNLQYLQLQESMQRESREFTAVSNIMKTRHETAKAAINNIH